MIVPFVVVLFMIVLFMAVVLMIVVPVGEGAINSKPA